MLLRLSVRSSVSDGVDQAIRFHFSGLSRASRDPSRLARKSGLGTLPFQGRDGASCARVRIAAPSGRLPCCGSVAYARYRLITSGSVP